MEAMINQNPFGAHGDIMGASPEDDQGKATLCEEIKNRARAEFGRKNLPQAEILYSKGLKIKPEDATLHSNLAAVRLGLNKTQAALENAEEAVRLDPTYAKGHYRKGQALMALSRPADAAEAFRAGAALEPESKLWGPLVQKAVKAAEAAVAAPSKQVAAASSRTSAGATKNTPTASSVSSRSSAAGGEKVAAGEGRGEGVAKENGGVGGGGGGRDMKGYKKTADGRVTTYFNNDLTEEAKALIGDIAPKRLDAVGGDAGQEAAGGDVSAWNKAGTWESRDMTSWAKQRLKELLLGVEFDASEGVVEVVAVEKIEGDAEISFSRGKKRFLFDFRLELKWEASDLECGPAKGVLVYPDFGQDCNGVYDAECRVDSSTPSAAKAYVDRHIRAERSGLREAVLARLVTFTSEFNSK